VGLEEGESDLRGWLGDEAPALRGVLLPPETMTPSNFEDGGRDDACDEARELDDAREEEEEELLGGAALDGGREDEEGGFSSTMIIYCIGGT